MRSNNEIRKCVNVPGVVEVNVVIKVKKAVMNSVLPLLQPHLLVA